MVVAYVMVLCQYLPGRADENQKTSVRIAGFWVKS